MNDLSKSDDYKYKKCLEKLGVVPTQSEVKARLGDALTTVFFDTCLPVLKPYLGLTPPLDGPPTELWVSPSDLLIGKVKLKPPVTSKYIKALTHKGILEIGEVVDQKLQKIQKHDIEKAVQDNTTILQFAAERARREAMRKTREYERERQKEIIQDLKDHFAQKLQRELAKLEERLKEEEKLAVEAGKLQVQKEMQLKMELAVMETVQRLTEQFAVELVKQSQCLHRHFWYHIRQEKRKLKKSIEDERAQCQENVAKLRTEMQCENIANIMYILAKERRRCACEKQTLTENFEARLNELAKELEERGDKLQKTICELETSGKEILAREAAMFEIIKQFQKFIYFVLRAVPTQAEYLLNVEKLMIFELTQNMVDSKPELFRKEKSESGRPEDGTSEGKFTGTTTTLRESSYDGGLVAKDYHGCHNRRRFLASAHTLDGCEDLPGFTYGDKLYVREDFRNMLSQGLKISESHELWNFCVHDMIKFIVPDEPETSDIELSQRIKRIIPDDQKDTVSHTNHISFVQETVLQSHQYEEESSPKFSIGDIEEEINVSVIDKTMPPEPDFEEHPKKCHQSKIVLAKDSLTLLKEKGLDHKKKIFATEKKSSVSKKDSLLISVKKSVESKISGTREILARALDSKIDLHVDSLILLKSKDAFKPILNGDPDESSTFFNKKKVVSIGVQSDAVSKSVHISHIEIIPEKSKQKESTVMFYSHPNIIPATKESSADSADDSITRSTPEEIYGRESEIKVIGDRSSTSHTESQDEFTAKRVVSFIRIFKEDPTLRRLFTEASRN